MAKLILICSSHIHNNHQRFRRNCAVRRDSLLRSVRNEQAVLFEVFADGRGAGQIWKRCATVFYRLDPRVLPVCRLGIFHVLPYWRRRRPPLPPWHGLRGHTVDRVCLIVWDLGRSAHRCVVNQKPRGRKRAAYALWGRSHNATNLSLCHKKRTVGENPWYGVVYLERWCGELPRGLLQKMHNFFNGSLLANDLWPSVTTPYAASATSTFLDTVCPPPVHSCTLCLPRVHQPDFYG